MTRKASRAPTNEKAASRRMARKAPVWRLAPRTWRRMVSLSLAKAELRLLATGRLHAYSAGAGRREALRGGERCALRR